MTAHKVCKFLFYSLLLAQITACSVELRDKAEESTNLNVQSQGIFPLFPLQGPHYRIEASVQPNAYRLKILPPAGTSQTERIELSKVESKKSWSLGFEFEDQDVQLGHSYEYRFLASNRSEIARVSLQMPIDLAVNDYLDFRKANPGVGTDNLRIYRRIFLGPEARLQVFNQNIEIQAEEIYSEAGATLFSFPEVSSKPALDYQGLSGGKVLMKIGSAHGLLKLEMRGENGGDGSEGVSYTGRAAKGDAAPAKHGFRHCENMGKGGPGAPGAKGHKGQPGGRGGHTGSFEFVAEDRSGFKIEKMFIPGRAGQPGKGGPGQLGGLGGASEQRSWQEPPMRGPDFPGHGPGEFISCRSLPDGDVGATGAPGDPGDRGQDGREASFCERNFNESCAR